jgi:putative ABC transport system permease protein
MRWLHRTRAVLAGLFRRRTLDEQLERDIAFHLDQEVAEGMRAGLAASEARRRARASFGSVDAVREDVRERRRLPVVEQVVQDVRYAVRQACRQPGTALLPLGLVALAVAALATTSSFAYSVLLRPLPWPDADRLVAVEETREGASRHTPNTMTNATYLAWREAPETIVDLAGFSTRTVTLETTDEAERLRIVSGTASLFEVLRTPPLHGRVFTEMDEMSSGDAVAVVSFALWHRRLGGRTDALGRTLTLDGESYRIVGIMPEHFAFPTEDVDAWLPWQVRPVLDPADPYRRSVYLFRGIARLAPGATALQASAEATARGHAAPDLGRVGDAVFGTRGKPRLTVIPYLEAQTSAVRPALALLVGAVCLLVVTAMANIAGMQLARAVSRRRELAIRAAIGAGAGRLARQALVECLTLGLAGGTVGALLTYPSFGVFRQLLPASFPRTGDIEADARVIAGAVVLALFGSLIFAVAPASITRRLNLVETLADDGLAPAGVSSASRVGRLRRTIIAAQVAIAVVLLIGATLLARSFVGLLQADRGYEPAGVLTAVLPMPDARFDGGRRAAMLDAIVERLSAAPGVISAAAGSAIPLVPYDQPFAVTIDPAVPGGQRRSVSANLRTVSPSYFEAIGMRILRGRALSDADATTSAPVVVVNRAFAAAYLPGDGVGVRLPMLHGIQLGSPEVVGVVEDAQAQAGVDAASPEVFVRYRQIKEGMRTPTPVVVIRTGRDPAALTALVRETVRGIDRAVAIDSIVAMEDRLLTSLAQPRLYAVVLAVFAGFTLLLAASGLFGVLSYSVGCRTREIGVRAALGARPIQIVSLVMRQEALVAAAGLAGGLILAALLVSSMARLLYGVPPRDPLTFAAVAALVIAVCCVAAVAPIRRAMRVERCAWTR